MSEKVVKQVEESSPDAGLGGVAKSPATEGATGMTGATTGRPEHFRSQQILFDYESTTSEFRSDFHALSRWSSLPVSAW